MSDVWGTVVQMERDKALGDDADSLRKENRRLMEKIDAALQRLNESGAGEMGLIDTIHATHAILRG